MMDPACRGSALFNSAGFGSIGTGRLPREGARARARTPRHPRSIHPRPPQRHSGPLRATCPVGGGAGREGFASGPEPQIASPKPRTPPPSGQISGGVIN
jgi:hypothetical protein